MMTPSIDWLRAIPRFLHDADSLFADEKKRLVTFPDLFFGLAYLGGGHLFLSHALQAWASGALCRPCPDCGLPVYVLRASGSPLSGSGGWSGVCSQCGTVHLQTGVSDLVRHPMVLRKWAHLGCRPLLQAASPWTFSFADGAVQQGDKVEIRLEVPTWREFILDYDPGLLIDPEPNAAGSGQPEAFGLRLRGKVVTLGTQGVQVAGTAQP